MKKSIDFGKLVFFVSAILLSAAIPLFAQETQPFSINNSPLPPSTGFVNDFAGVIDAATKQQLETKLKDLKETTNPQVEIAVAVVKTTGERDIFDYSLAVARGWKIGSKDDDNPSALLFVAVDDRKYFTQVSKDLEDELPDGLVGSLQRQNLVPEFKKGNYSQGISDTIDAYITTIRNKGNTAAAPQKPATERKPSSGLSLSGVFCCGAFVLVILILVFSRSKRGRNDDDDDDWGGGAASALPWVIGSIIANSGSSSGSSGGWGGSSGGGGSDWGGFGGGGDFGGGGAGGDW
ncbi:MAG: TPM domain-containing protein [Pyrinomonadaceae bacterium]